MEWLASRPRREPSTPLAARCVRILYRFLRGADCSSPTRWKPPFSTTFCTNLLPPSPPAILSIVKTSKALVALTGGLSSGTIVSNQAMVYFPSVPEETPTNAWVNLVTPLVAEPQSLTTAYMTPLAITLSGREVSWAAADLRERRATARRDADRRRAESDLHARRELHRRR